MIPVPRELISNWGSKPPPLIKMGQIKWSTVTCVKEKQSTHWHTSTAIANFKILMICHVIGASDSSQPRWLRLPFLEFGFWNSPYFSAAARKNEINAGPNSTNRCGINDCVSLLASVLFSYPYLFYGLMPVTHFYTFLLHMIWKTPLSPLWTLVGV